jgi:hypothetical protein
MKLTGLMTMIVGWLLATVVALQVGSVGGRFALAIIGITIILYGLLGLLNKAHLKTAIWKQSRLR